MFKPCRRSEYRAADFCCYLYNRGEASRGALAVLRAAEGYRKWTKLCASAAPSCSDLPHSKHLSCAVACRALSQGMHFCLEIAALLVNLMYGPSLSSLIREYQQCCWLCCHLPHWWLEIACRIFMQVLHIYIYMALCFVLPMLQIRALAWCFVAGWIQVLTVSSSLCSFCKVVAECHGAKA